jgi:hypothetical protein
VLRRRRRLALLVATSLIGAAAPLVLAGPSSAASSVNAKLQPTFTSGDTMSTSISQDGRWVATRSTGSPTIAGGTFVDNNGIGGDALLYDTQNNTAVLISGALGSATQGVNADVTSVQISDDGGVVVFATTATNVVASPVVGAPNTRSHVYRWVRATDTTEMIDVAGSSPSGGSSLTPRPDADGSVVAFSSTSTDLIAGVTYNGGTDVFVADFGTGPGVDSFELISHAAGTPTVSPPGGPDSDFPTISADGGVVAFVTTGTGFVASVTDANSETDIYRYVRATDTAQLVSRAGTQALVTADSHADDPSISETGRFVAYESHSENVQGATSHNGPVGSFPSLDDVYLFDAQSATTELISASTAPGGTTESSEASGLGTQLGPSNRLVSPDGRFVTFLTGAVNQVAAGVSDGNGGGRWDVVVRDRELDLTIPVNTVAGNQASTSDDNLWDEGFVGTGEGDGGPAMAFSCSGIRVAYANNSTDIVASDTNVGYDGFVATVDPDGSVLCTPPPTTTTTTTTQPPTTTTTTTAPPPPPPTPTVGGYWMLSDAGEVYPFGNAAPLAGASGPETSAHAIVDIVNHPDGGGYWVLASDGMVWASGTAQILAGGPVTLLAGERATGISTTPHGMGYWVFTDRGRVFPFGNAQTFGDLAALTLNGPVLDAVGTPTGNGYYMVGSDGGVFSFGDAGFYGSTGNLRLNRPVRGLVPTATNLGYWLVADDGGIFAFGDAPFLGSMGATVLNQPVVAAVRFGEGYLMVARDGGIFNFSSQQFYGSLGGSIVPNPIVAVAPSPSA